MIVAFKKSLDECMNTLNQKKTLSDGIALNNSDIMNINNLLIKKQEKLDSNLVE